MSLTSPAMWPTGAACQGDRRMSWKHTTPHSHMVVGKLIVKTSLLALSLIRKHCTFLHLGWAKNWFFIFESIISVFLVGWLPQDVQIKSPRLQRYREDTQRCCPGICGCGWAKCFSAFDPTVPWRFKIQRTKLSLRSLRFEFNLIILKSQDVFHSFSDSKNVF